MSKRFLKSFAVTFAVLVVLLFLVYWAVPQYAVWLEDSGVRGENLSTAQKLLIAFSNVVKNQIVVVIVGMFVICGVVAAIVDARPAKRKGQDTTSVLPPAS